MPKAIRQFSRVSVFAAALLLLALLTLGPGLLSAGEAREIPAPVIDEAVGAATSETAVLAGGCFWGVQGVYQHVEGVTSAVSGYAGGDKETALYQIVGRGTTGHAESVRITFDPRKISYGRILQVYFSVAHNPTELNRQGPDTGTQYRSAIFPANMEQARIAEAYIAQLDKAHVFDGAIVTKIEPNKIFYPAEAYHQDFLVQHLDYPYIVMNDLPKIGEFKRLLPEIYRSDPVLTLAPSN
jgi:peptide-methionine (S)-S-oxide reductase